MVEKTRRAPVERDRDDADPAWEVFVREEADDSLRFVGTVRADDAGAAHERATRLFAWYAEEVWVCPSAEVRKFSADAADEDERAAVPPSGSEQRYHEP